MRTQRRLTTFCLAGMTALGLALLTVQAAPEKAAKADDWSQLFNGKDLSGWDTWLGRPDKSVEGLDLKKNDKGEYTESVGLNKDPKKVYTVVTEDGKPAIRISGEIFGALTSKDEFENYHFKLEFKWGEAKYAPRDKQPRDSGLLYHCTGEHGKVGTFWMQSLECQIMEHDCGSFYNVGGNIIVDVAGQKNDKGRIQYKKGGEKFTGVTSSILHGGDYEKKNGEWNTVELLTVGGTAVHVINGKVAMVLTNTRHKVGGKEEPLTKGKIQIQSEGAEVFFRNVAVKPLKAIPEEYLK
jgi:hypothetical protein